jgi:hypothetical protein
MADAKKLIDAAYGSSGTPSLFSMERWFGRKDQSPQDQQRPRVLALGEDHADNSAEKFVMDNVKALQSHSVVADFIEMPYWFNAILEGYRKGAVTEKELNHHYKAFMESSRVPGAYNTMYSAQMSKIKRLAPTDINTIALDVRFETITTLPHVLRDSYRRAQELAKEFPESVKYRGFIKAALEQGLPEDAIAASLVSLYLSEKKGNGVVTYGNGHFVGECNPEYENQGIIDDAMEKQGIAVTHAAIARDMQGFRFAEEIDETNLNEKKKHIQAGDKEWIACKATADQMDFLYLYKQRALIPKEQFPKEKRKDLLPYPEYSKAEEVYRADQLDPTLIKELRDKLIDAGVTKGPNAVALPLSQSSARNRIHDTVPPK